MPVSSSSPPRPNAQAAGSRTAASRPAPAARPHPLAVCFLHLLQLLPVLLLCRLPVVPVALLQPGKRPPVQHQAQQQP
jgi:hypothetical protein